MIKQSGRTLRASVALMMLALAGITLSGHASAYSNSAAEICKPFDTESHQLDVLSGSTPSGGTEILKRQEASEFDSILPFDDRCVVRLDIYSCNCGKAETSRIVIL